jgi:hypothetical protein
MAHQPTLTDFLNSLFVKFNWKPQRTHRKVFVTFALLWLILFFVAHAKTCRILVGMVMVDREA